MRSRKPKGKQHSSGFSVIEMLVVVGIISILSGTLLGFNRSSEKTIALATEQQRVMSILARARSLAVQRYTGGSEIYTCGILVNLSGGSISTLAVTRAKNEKITTCPLNAVSATSVPTNQTIESRVLEKGVTIKSGPAFIYFSSPFLETTFSPDTGTSGIITLQVAGVPNEPQIEVTTGGSIMQKIN